MSSVHLALATYWKQIELYVIQKIRRLHIKFWETLLYNYRVNNAVDVTRKCNLQPYNLFTNLGTFVNN